MNKFILMLRTIKISAPISWDDKKSEETIDRLENQLLDVVQDRMEELKEEFPELTFELEY